MSEIYRRDMQPWPALAKYSRTIPLPGQTGKQLHIYDAGDKAAPAVMLIHGLADEADSWRHVIQPLAQQYRVIALDLPGFGRSDLPARGYGITYLCEIVREVFNMLAVPRATLIGSSLGAIIAHTVAVRWPVSVAGLVLVDGGLAMEPQKLRLKTLLGLLPLVGERWYNGLRRDADKTYATLRSYYAKLDAMPQADREFLFQRVNERVWNDRQRTAYFGILRNFPLWMLRDSRRYATHLASLTVDTLVIWGEQDRILSLSNAHALIRTQPSASLCTIPNAGHLPHQEQPEAFLAVIKQLVW